MHYLIRSPLSLSQVPNVLVTCFRAGLHHSGCKDAPMRNFSFWAVKWLTFTLLFNFQASLMPYLGARVGWLAAHDAPGKHVNDKGNVLPALSGADVGEV